MDYEDGDH